MSGQKRFHHGRGHQGMIDRVEERGGARRGVPKSQQEAGKGSILGSGVDQDVASLQVDAARDLGRLSPQDNTAGNLEEPIEIEDSTQKGLISHPCECFGKSHSPRLARSQNHCGGL